MSVSLRGKTDTALDKVLQVFSTYEAQHPGAHIEAYRYNPYSLRIRVVDPGFEGIGFSTRHDDVWKYVALLPEDVQKQMGLFLLLTPEERQNSLVNIEFDHDHPPPPDE